MPGKMLLRIGLLVAFLALLPACRSETAAPTGSASTTAVKLLIAEDGLYRVTLDALQDAGLQAEALSPDTVGLSTGGRAVPFLAQDDALIFYGLASQDRYVSQRPYIVRVGEQGETMGATAVDGPATPALDTVAQSLHIEDNHLYAAEALSDDEPSDVWFWHKLQQGADLPVTFELPTVADAPATLRLNLWGFTHNREVENDHDLDILVNGQNVGTVRWDGQVYHTGEVAIPAGVLQPGENTVLLDNKPEGATFLDIMLVNWLQLDYTAPATAVSDYLSFTGAEGTVAIDGLSAAPVVIDISQADAPQRLTGWTFNGATLTLPAGTANHIAAAAPDGFRAPAGITPLRDSSWRDTTRQADLIIVTTDELAPALEPLVAAREKQGLSVATVPVAEIYDEFGHGADSPTAIRDFVAYAYENWSAPQPRYLFLVGDATSDYRGYLGELPANHVPTLLVPVMFSGETASDERLADVDGDLHAELAVGRWPVRTRAAVEDLVERTLAYENGRANANTLFAADGTESQFAHIATRLSEESQIPTDQVELLTGPQAGEVTAAWNAGPWLTTYIGHGSIGRWGKEDIFSLEAVSDLSSSQTPPIVLQLTCLTGLFSHPEETSLSEAMLAHDSGPVLLVAATSLTLSSNQEPFATAFLKNLRDPQITRVGDALHDAKLTLDVQDNPGLREISDTFTLFGDPSTRIVRP